jgi:hypothetical protein
VLGGKIELSYRERECLERRTAFLYRILKEPTDDK